jgi:tetratricopeptide (TPR) repeat protein
MPWRRDASCVLAIILSAGTAWATSKDATKYMNLAGQKYSQGDIDGAISDYDQALRLDPDFARAYNGRGLAKYDEGSLDAAIAD